MSSKEYMAEYRARKASGTFKDKRKRHFPSDNCLECGTELKRERSNKPRKYCNNNVCQHLHQRKQAIELGIAGNGSTKTYLLETRGNKCEICNISEWNNKPLTLDLDHINGNHNDNSLSNVRLLCPNCHSQTETYKSKNTGNGRSLNKTESKPFYPSLSNLYQG